MRSSLSISGCGWRVWTRMVVDMWTPSELCLIQDVVGQMDVQTDVRKKRRLHALPTGNIKKFIKHNLACSAYPLISWILSSRFSTRSSRNNLLTWSWRYFILSAGPLPGPIKTPLSFLGRLFTWKRNILFSWHSRYWSLSSKRVFMHISDHDLLL